MEAEIEGFEPGFKLLVSIVGLIGILAFWLVSDSKHDSGRFWALGKADPVRVLLYDRDGRLRRNAKPAFALVVVLFIILVWLT
jgi:hypothetical protein